MTFDLTDVQQRLCARAREVGDRMDDLMAKTIDEGGAIPETLRRLVAEALPDPFVAGEVAAAAALGELAVASPGLAASVGFAAVGGPGAVEPVAWPGLRGAERAVAVAEQARGRQAARAQLVVCAISVGVGRAAVAHAVRSMQARGVRPGGDERTPHWMFADAATEVEGGRLLTLRAAQLIERGEDAAAALALARTLATGAAIRAVSAAIAVEGPSGYQRGSRLERLDRDAKTLSLVLPA